MCSSVSLPGQASLCLCDPTPPSFLVWSSSQAAPLAPGAPASLQRWDGTPHWLQILTLCRRPSWSWCDKWILPAAGNTALSHPRHTAHASLSPSRRAQPREQGAELPRVTICSCQHLCWAPTVTSVERNSVLDELLERSLWSPPSSLLVITGLLGSRGCICVRRLPGLICINWKSVTGS